MGNTYFRRHKLQTIGVRARCVISIKSCVLPFLRFFAPLQSVPLYILEHWSTGANALVPRF
jgi:hypothetical protein